MKYFVIFLILVGFVALTQQSFAWCMENEDWKDAPCYGAAYQNFSKEKIQNDWESYYDYKGQEWMEQKKVELMIAIRDGYHEEWHNESDANSNVFQYYYAFYDMDKYQNIYSPHKQLTEGFPFNEVQCKENLVLIQKYDGSPACVTESTKLKLIERGWSTSENRIKISDTSKSIHDKIDGASCSNGTIIPSYNDTRIIPVLMMHPNSTGTICITYDFPYDWESYPNKDWYPDHKFHFDLIDIDSEHFTITANPEWIDTRTISAGDNVAVTYKIHADSNSQGLYDTVIPYGNCTRYPMAVGYDESEITSSDFPEAPRIPPCVLVFSGEKHVSLVSEMDYFELDYR